MSARDKLEQIAALMMELVPQGAACFREVQLGQGEAAVDAMREAGAKIEDKAVSSGIHVHASLTIRNVVFYAYYARKATDADFEAWVRSGRPL